MPPCSKYVRCFNVFYGNFSLQSIGKSIKFFVPHIFLTLWLFAPFSQYLDKLYVLVLPCMWLSHINRQFSLKYTVLWVEQQQLYHSCPGYLCTVHSFIYEAQDLLYFWYKLVFHNVAFNKFWRQFLPSKQPQNFIQV